jgi:molybdenum cofactor cytidylyltransferase
MISAILLAGGQSKRMKGENKLTKKIHGIPLINHSIKNILSSSINELIIVLGYEKEVIKKIIKNNDKIKFVFNKNFKTGMASSIIAGLKKISKKNEAFFICLGDMPYIKSEIYNHLINSRNTKDIAVPIYNGTQGNPVLFANSMKKNIMTIKGDVGAKKILNLNKNKIESVHINNININKDFNTKESFSF